MILGELERVELRTVWENEAVNFTPWLAQEDNLATLGRAIGLELELVGQEQFVGPYRADVLCKDTLTDCYVLIENQLEKTNHNHLGQILTYAAGLNAKVVVWVASRFTDEHRAAMDWLNEISGEDFGFFGLEIELWKIGSSLPAPKFNVISSPNEWRKPLSDSQAIAKISDTKQLYHRYWEGLRAFLREQPNCSLRSQKPSPRHWTSFAIGRSGFTLHATASAERYSQLGAELYISPKDLDPKAAFHALLADKENIEAKLGFRLEWRELPDAIGARLIIFKQNTDIANEADWPSQFAWIAEHLGKMHDVLGPIIKRL